MKKLLTLCFASSLTVTALADTFTFKPSDADIGDLDHHYAYTWGINMTLAPGTTITGATLKIKNIWDWRDENNDKLFIRLLDNTATGIKQWQDNTADNVVKDFFAGQGTELYEWTDSKGGYARNYDLGYNFSASELIALTNYITNGHSYNKADFGIAFDPDCHYYNDGISLTITTANRVPDGGLTVLLLGFGLVAIASIRRIFPS